MRNEQLMYRSVGISLILALFPIVGVVAGGPTVLNGHTDAVYDVAFSPDGTLLASGSYDNSIKLWQVDDGKLIATLKGHSDQVFRVAFSHDGKRLASSGGDSHVLVWDLETYDQVANLTGHGDPMIDVTFSIDGKSLATAGSHIQFWNAEREIWSTPHSELYFSVAFSPDERQLACGTRNLVHFFDVSGAQLVKELVAGEGMIYEVAYSPDGKWLATTCSDGNLSLWDAVNYKKLKTVRADKYSLFALCFSDDGKQLLTAGRERVIRAWELPEMSLLNERYGPQETILSVTLSHDGKYLACGSYDGMIHLWALKD